MQNSEEPRCGSEKGQLIAILAALDLEPKLRVLITDRFAPSDKYNATREEANRMADELKRIYPNAKASGK